MGNLNDDQIGGNDPAASDENDADCSVPPGQMSAEDGEATDEQSKSPDKKPSIADRLVKYARARAKLFHTPENEAYATIREAGHRETWPIKSSEFARSYATSTWLRTRLPIPKP